MFLDKDRGIRKVSAIQEYDDLAVTEEEGQKVNAWLAAHFTAEARLWTLPDRGEIWIRPSALNDVLCWSERYRGWTRIDLGTPVTAVCEADGTVYIALGAKIYKLTDSFGEPGDKARHGNRARAGLRQRPRHDRLSAALRADGRTGFMLLADRPLAVPGNGEKTTKYQIYVADELRPVLKSSGGTVVLDKFLMTEAEVV